MELRPVRSDDAAAVARIYNHYIRHSTAVFLTEPVRESEMVARIDSCAESGMPFRVGIEDGRVVGFAYMQDWNPKTAFSATQEVTVYLDPAYTGAGRGGQLLGELLDAVDHPRVHVLVAAISLPNEASVRLHEKFGFRRVSHFREVGFKFGRWIDLGHWQLIR